MIEPSETPMLKVAFSSNEKSMCVVGGGLTSQAIYVSRYPASKLEDYVKIGSMKNVVAVKAITSCCSDPQQIAIATKAIRNHDLPEVSTEKAFRDAVSKAGILESDICDCLYVASRNGSDLRRLTWIPDSPKPNYESGPSIDLVWPDPENLYYRIGNRIVRVGVSTGRINVIYHHADKKASVHGMQLTPEGNFMLCELCDGRVHFKEFRPPALITVTQKGRPIDRRPLAWPRKSRRCWLPPLFANDGSMYVYPAAPEDNNLVLMHYGEEKPVKLYPAGDPMSWLYMPLAINSRKDELLCRAVSPKYWRNLDPAYLKSMPAPKPSTFYFTPKDFEHTFVRLSLS